MLQKNAPQKRSQLRERQFIVSKFYGRKGMVESQFPSMTRGTLSSAFSELDRQGPGESRQIPWLAICPLLPSVWL